MAKGVRALSYTLWASRRVGSVAKNLIQRFTLGVLLLGALASSMLAQASHPAIYSDMHWRAIGPPRAGRARALSGVPSEPNVFYIGFDNGGVWRSTDFGSTWVPLFDNQPTGSIGAIAVAPSDPNVIYVGSGAGIIRPDLAVGDGMYKSTDAGKTWTHLQLRDTQMIANVAVDLKNPNRLFVAALGHPYGPNAERGIFRSTDGGASFQRSEHHLRGAVAAATGLRGKWRLRRHRRRDFQVHRWRDHVEAVDHWSAAHYRSEFGDCAEQFQSDLRDGGGGWNGGAWRRARRWWRRRDWFLQDHRWRRPLVPGDR
jgi:hypothetical protein